MMEILFALDLSLVMEWQITMTAMVLILILVMCVFINGMDPTGFSLDLILTEEQQVIGQVGLYISLW